MEGGTTAEVYICIWIGSVGSKMKSGSKARENRNYRNIPA